MGETQALHMPMQLPLPRLSLKSSVLSSVLLCI